MATVLKTYDVRGLQLRIEDSVGSRAAEWVASELDGDTYGLERIVFQPGDVVIDVGAHVGLFALTVALRHPEVTVVSLEPEPTNFRNLAANVARHGALNVLAFNLAVTKDGRSFELHRPPVNSGGASGYSRFNDGYSRSVAASVTLDQVFARFAPRGCRLLKLDCEGAEHEILPACGVLHDIEWFAAEFHINDALAEIGCSNEGLVDLVARHVQPARMIINSIVMGQ